MKTQHRSTARREQPALPFKPRTIDYRCKRCGLVDESQPLPTDPKALAVYGLPEGWTLASAHRRMPEEEDDFCWCTACTADVRAGYPEDLRDLGRSR